MQLLACTMQCIQYVRYRQHAQDICVLGCGCTLCNMFSNNICPPAPLPVTSLHPTQVWFGMVQTVQYIQPRHAAQLSQAELVVIDEAAAIPLPVVKTLLGPYLVFLCSTVNGYEGTGRSLSLKLIEQLRTEVNWAAQRLVCMLSSVIC